MFPFLNKLNFTVSFEPSFAFDKASPIDRQEQLLYSEYMSDVVFTVGAEKELIHAHKIILTLASEVFYDQFNCASSASHQNNVDVPIAIPDIEPAIFRQVLSYIYCEKIHITGSNVIDVSFIAKKYKLRALADACEKFIETSINEEDVWDILHRNQKYNQPNVESICLGLIQDNPLRYFKSVKFLSMSRQIINLIANCETMNCNREQLAEALDQWRRANNSEDFFRIALHDLRCRRLHIFGSPLFSRQRIESYFTISARKQVSLYGVGVFIGRRPTVVPDCNEVNITINTIHGKTTKKVPLKSDLYVEEVLFEKVTIAKNYRFDVTVARTMPCYSTQLFCLEDSIPVDTLGDVDLTVDVRKEHYCPIADDFVIPGFNCVSYLLYNIDE